jgi:type IV fimbrial biogenesis protein FimT
MTNRALVRRDPQKGKKGFSNQKGFTVIELLIAVAVIAIIASLALPSYRAIVEKRQVTSAAEQLTAFLSSMKGEAVKLNEDLAFVYSASDQCMGFHQPALTGSNTCSCAAASNTCKVSTDLDGQGNSTLTSDRVFRITELREPDVFSSLAMTDGSVLMYDSVRGILEADSTSGLASGMSVSLVSTGDLYALNVQVDRMGRIEICNPTSGSHSAVPGYDDC